MRASALPGPASARSAVRAAHAPAGDAVGDEAQPHRALVACPDDMPSSGGNRIRLFRRQLLHVAAQQYAPGGAAEVVVMIDLEGGIRLVDEPGEEAALTSADEDVAAVDPVVHRDDLDPPVVHETDPPDRRRREQPEALVLVDDRDHRTRLLDGRKH